MDYNAEAEITQTFFAAVQNKLHFAIHGHTAAELIVKRADSTKERKNPETGCHYRKKLPHTTGIKNA